MKKKVVVLLALLTLFCCALKINRSVNLSGSIKPSIAASIEQSQDNRDPKDINTSAESRKRREPGQQQR